ncbi:MAG TPA: sigma-70 family RNA polymerase sigma factor [Candidatus Sulfopaludibacter sp.]|nr:sigma-70 family RNA polymerase sigma factor [Candidatus Sulfopaludibacter sp.]
MDVFAEYKLRSSGSQMAFDPDVELMLRVGRGEAGSHFAVLMNKHRPAVVHFIYRKVNNLALAEELSQEVFLRVFRSRQSYQPTAKFRTWLFRIATNLALNAVRDSRNEAESSAPLQIADRRPSVEDLLVHQVKFGEVRQAIARLPELQRTAVVMQRYREMDYAAIARALHCSESAVKSLLFRAHETLRRSLAHMDPVAKPAYLDRMAS